MNKNNLEIKIGYTQGLMEVVEKEIKQKTNNQVLIKGDDFMYLDFGGTFERLLNLKSIGNISLVTRDVNFNPAYLSKHKDVLKNLIDTVFGQSKDKFKTFRISCAGSDSEEVKSIIKYIENEYSLYESLEADLKINIYKVKNSWEISVQVTKRPLSYRLYKVANMSGAMDANIAYALNYFCELESKKTYLNIFSGSATLLIEAAQEYNNLQTLIGFDSSKQNLSLGYHNVQKAGLIEKIKLFEYDIFSKPELGKFDVIVADLPFGMAISKSEDLSKLYQMFIEYAYMYLNEDGVLGIYTSEHDTFMDVLDINKWKVVKTVKLKLVTNINSYLYPKIILCKKI